MKARRFALASFLVAVLGALVAAFAPTGRMESTTSSGGAFVTHTSSISMFQTNGAWVLIVVSVPVLVSLVAVVLNRRSARIVSTVLLWIGCVLGMFSVGMFFIPAAILMTIAASAGEPVPVPPLPPIPTG
jgi:hypothetical protein